eukprot:UN10322
MKVIVITTLYEQQTSTVSARIKIILTVVDARIKINCECKDQRLWMHCWKKIYLYVCLLCELVARLYGELVFIVCELTVN